MKTKLVLGVSGHKGSGKDTFYSIIKKSYPQVQRKAIADQLKMACSEVFNVKIKHFNSPKLKEEELENFIYLTEDKIIALLNKFNLEYNYDLHVRPHISEVIKTPRKLAQYVGTEILRSFDLDLHIKLLCDTLKEEFILITDVRFLNEFDYLKKEFGDGFFGIYIDNYTAALKAEADPHLSEKEVKLIGKRCIRIENNGSLKSFEEASLQAVRNILSSHRIVLGE